MSTPLDTLEAAMLRLPLRAGAQSVDRLPAGLDAAVVQATLLDVALAWPEASLAGWG